jgi:hypothetical protein
MTDDQHRDQRRDAVNDGLRSLARANRVRWVPSTSRDAAEQRRDRDALNDAIRRAWLGEAQTEADTEPSEPGYPDPLTG